MSLRDTTARNAKPAAKPRKLSDDGGLHLLVQPNGSKLWRLSYRFAGKQKTLSLGAYPIVTLADARGARDAARKLLARGVDPSVQRKIDRQIEQANAESSFRAVAEEVISKLEREGRAHVTILKKRWLLDFAFPAFGDRPVAEITARELLALLRQIEKRGLYETAKRLRSTCGMVFRFAIATGRAERDPSADLRGALTSHQVSHRATIIEPSGIGALLRAVDGFEAIFARQDEAGPQYAADRPGIASGAPRVRARISRRQDPCRPFSAGHQGSVGQPLNR